MMESNELVNEFLIDKFRKEAKQSFRIGFKATDELPGYDKEKHLARCESIAVQVKECGWECGCYSEVTREDYFELSAHVGCDCGVEMRWNYGSMWEIPRFLEELEGYKSLREVCYYEAEEY